MLANGFGEHNIQGIGDKHIPLIHNVMATDLVVGVSDRATDQLLVLFNTAVGREYLVRRRGVPAETVAALGSLGLSSICNVLAAIKVARNQRLGPDDVILTVATDGAELYGTELERIVARDFPGGFDAVAAGRDVRGLAGGRRRRPRPRGHARRPRPHLRPRLLHLGGAAGRVDRGVRGPARPGVLDGDPRDRGPLGRADRRVQRAGHGTAGMTSVPEWPGRAVVSTGAGHRRDAVPPPAVETGLVCAGCGALAPAHRPFTPRCPNRRPGDDIDHVMARGIDLLRLDPPADPDPNPFVRYRALFHAYHVARAAGWGDARYVDLVRELDDAVAGVDGHGFRVTPLVRAPAIARAAGLGPDGTVWVKDETGNVAGSHKARHLFGILLELRVAEALGDGDPASPLAIASCGNAALAAAVVARAAARELRVFVPESADAAVVDRLRELGAVVVTCPRRPGEAGDPSYLRLQEALADGRRPVHLPGPRQRPRDRGRGDACLGDRRRAARGRRLPGPDRRPGRRRGARIGDRAGVRRRGGDRRHRDRAPILDTVQARGGAPLARAYERVLADLGLVAGTPADPDVVHDGLRRVADHRSRYMWPWETEPASVAHGILDDETYDWLAVVRAMLVTGGRARRRRRARPPRGQRARLRGHRHRCRRDGHRRRGRPARARRGRAS